MSYQQFLFVAPATDSYVRKGDVALQGLVWDSEPGGIVMRVVGADKKATYQKVAWGERLNVQERNPLGTVVGRVENRRIFEL